MKFIALICFFIVGIANICGNNKNITSEKINAIKLLIYEEKTVPALTLFTKEINNSSQQKNHAETADNICWIAECLFRLRNMDALENVLNECEAFTKQYNTVASLKLKTIRGKYLIEKGKYRECISLLEKTATSVKENSTLCEIHLTLADANQRLQILQKSKTHYQYVADNAKDVIQIGRAYNGLGSYYCILSKLDSAKLYYNAAYNQFYKQLGPLHSRTAQIHYNLGLISDRNFDLFDAEQHFTTALTVYKNRLGDFHPRTAETYGALGSLLLMKDDPGKALYYSVKERDILIRLYGKENPDLAYSHLNCGKIYYLLNEDKQSEQQITRAIFLVKKYFGINHNLYSQCIAELSKIYTDRQQFQEAERILSDAIKFKENNPDELLADLYLQAGQNYLQQNLINNAQKYFTLADNIYTRIYGEKNTHSIEAVLGLSDCYLLKGDYNSAYSYAQLAYVKTTQDNKIIFPYDHWECSLHTIACKKELLKQNLIPHPDIKSEIENIKQVITEASRIKQTYYSTGSQLYYAEKMTDLNQLGIYFLTHFYKKTDAYFINNLLFFSENNKANLLRNKIINYKAEEILPAEEKEKSSFITGKLNYFITLNETKTDAPFNINDSILIYQNTYETFTRHIEKQYPKIYALKYGKKPVSVYKIQQKLPATHTLLEYFNDGENYYCLAISKSNITYKICGNKDKTDSLINLFQNQMLAKHYDAGLGYKIFKILVPQNLSINLIISPEENISLISFDALSSDPEKPAYLLFDHTFQYVFSASTYFNHPPSIQNKCIHAFYPDFANTSFKVLNSKKEHEALKLFPNYNVYHKQQATKEKFINNSKSAGVLHISSHLITDTISPLESYLVFQPYSNYKLSINEIWRLHTNCQLITLASCKSNFGKQQNGEGVQNFSWAFHYAGARNILSTQWNASDKSTSLIVSEFYRNLKNGKDKTRALQLAKINYLKKTDAIGAHPFYWSVFNLYGDESSVGIHPYFFVKFWWIPALLILLCYIALLIIRKIYRKKLYDHL